MTSTMTCFLFQEANKPPNSWFELKVNTHVYVTGLPEDATTDEVSFNNCPKLPSLFLVVRNLHGKYIAGGGGVFQVWHYKGGIILFLCYIDLKHC